MFGLLRSCCGYVIVIPALPQKENPWNASIAQVPGHLPASFRRRTTGKGPHVLIVEMQEKHQVTPGLAAVLVSDDPALAIYVRNKGRARERVVMFSETLPAFPRRSVSRPSHRETPKASASPILSRMSRPRIAALCLAACWGRRHRRERGAATATGSRRRHYRTRRGVCVRRHAACA